MSFGGGRLDVKTKVKASAAGCHGRVRRGVGRAPGRSSPTGTKPHEIRVKSPRSLHWGGDGYAVSVQHPGTTGRQYWRSAGSALDKAFEDVVTDVYDDALVA